MGSHRIAGSLPLCRSYTRTGHSVAAACVPATPLMYVDLAGSHRVTGALLPWPSLPAYRTSRYGILVNATQLLLKFRVFALASRNHKVESRKTCPGHISSFSSPLDGVLKKLEPDCIAEVTGAGSHPERDDPALIELKCILSTGRPPRKLEQDYIAERTGGGSHLNLSNQIIACVDMHIRQRPHARSGT